MSVNDPEQPEDAAANPLLEEAIAWCLRMNGEDSEAHRDEFEAWLALGGVHRQVYSQVSELHGFGERLRGRDIARNLGEVAEPRERFSFARWKIPTLRVGFLLILVLAGTMNWFGGEKMGSPRVESAARSTGQVQTALGEIRTVRLDDGSRLTLDTDSLVSFALEPGTRHVLLERGRVRFAPAQGERPFIVSAGMGQIMAHGGVFDIALVVGQSVDIALMHGAADIRSGDKWSILKPSRSLRLAAGYRASYGSGDRIMVARLARDEIARNDWTSGLMAFDGVQLSEVIRQANRYAVVKISLADPTLGQQRFHGTLRLNDTRKVAAIIARAYSLHLSEDGGTLRLSLE